MADQHATALPERDHNLRRTAWIGILLPYAVALAALVWNWW